MGLATMGWRVRNILIIILILSALLRLHGITNPYLDDQGWRQGDTASMAYNMLEQLDEYPEVFFPKLNYDGSGPQKVELEFPFLPYLLAWTWTIFGWGDFWGRLWAVIFSLLTILGVYKFSSAAFSPRVGLWAGIIYGLTPITIYYGRVVMPEPIAQAFSIWALVAILNWRKKSTWGRLLISSLFMAGAILGKLPQLMLFPVALLIGFFPFRRNIKFLLFYCFFALLGPMLYYTWVHFGAGTESQFVSGILSYQVAEGSTLYLKNLLENFQKGLSYPLLLIAILGLIIIIKDKKIHMNISYALGLWFLITFTYLVIICLKIPLDYYLVPMALPLALGAGYFLAYWQGKVGHGKRALLGGALVLGILSFQHLYYYQVKYQWNEEILGQALWIQENTEPNSVLLLSDSPPMTLYYAQRYGYRLTNPDEEQAFGDIRNYPSNYLVILPGSRSEEFRQKVKEFYREVGPDVYKL
ncbi:MAG: glycosyltransferase family 39 protein [Desulfitobacterium sp.]|nr:glycosyltransferase family 39 protein [Desulfitobacterium sp.]